MRVGSAIRDRAIGQGPWSFDYIHSVGIPARRLLWLAAIPIAAFAVAYGVGAATSNHAATPPVRLAPGVATSGASVRVTPVSSAGGVPALKVQRTRPAAHRETVVVASAPAARVAPAPVVSHATPAPRTRSVTRSAPRVAPAAPPVSESAPAAQPTAPPSRSASGGGGSPGPTTSGTGTTSGGG